MNEGEIDGQPYPIAIGERGETLWQTTDVGRVDEETWDDWSAGIGETKRETGRGYLFSEGFDASQRGVLRLSPFYQNLNNTALTTARGYFMEDVEASASALVIDTTASSTTDANTGSGDDTSFNHTVDNNAERVLMFGLSINYRLDPELPGQFPFLVRYAGVTMTPLGMKVGASGTDATVALWYLLAPATGTNAVVITNFGAAANLVCGAHSWHGADQDTPFGTVVTATGTDGTPTVTATTAATEEILAVVGIEGLETMTAGTNETEHWDAQLTDITGGGYVQDGANGGVMAPTLDAKAGTEQWVIIAVSIKPASAGSRGVMHLSDTTKIFKYTYDADSGLTLDATDTTASGVAGRPTKMNDNWYSPMGTSASAQKLSGITWADVTGTWQAYHLATYQQGIEPTLARVNPDTQNTVDLNKAAGDVGDTWTQGSEEVGDTTTKITDMVEMQGFLMVAKEDSLYRYGLEGESFSVIPFLARGKGDTENGKGLDSFGDEVIYPSKGNLWRHRTGGGSLPIGVNTIEGWRKISAIPTPKDGRHVFEVHAEGYRYTLLNKGETSHLLQRRGNSNVYHSVLTIPLSNALGLDSSMNLWIKGASTDEGVRDVRVIQLADDGSLDLENRKGQASTDHNIYFDERNPGNPQDKVQIRHITVELEGDWDATTSLQLKLWLDDATTAIAHGAAITAAGVTTRLPTTFGTSDTCYRFRLQLTLTTNSSYAPKSSDAQILRVIVGIRFPEIISIVIPADEGVLTGTTAIDVEQNLRRLQNQGVVAFLRPGDLATFNAEIFSVTDVMYATEDNQYAHGIKVEARRWLTP